MPATSNRSTRYRVMFDGQSFNIIPPAPDNFVPQLMNHFPGVPRQNPSQGSTPWNDLYTRAPQDIWPWGPKADYSVLVMNGGTNNVLIGQTGQQIYDIQKAYAQAARAAGFKRIVTCTIITSSAFNGTMETNRNDGNAKILANADGAFDGVADMAGDGRFSTPGDGLYYLDGTHPAAPAGVAVEVQLFLPFLKQWIT